MFIRLVALISLLASTGIARADEPHEIAEMLDKAKVSLVDALATAQEKAPGGTLMDIEIETDDDATVWEVELLVDEKIKVIKVDAATGQVRKVREHNLPEDQRAQLIKTGQAVSDATANQTLDIAAALAAAADATGGRPYEAKMKVRGDRLVYDVRAVVEDKLREALIAADTHEVLRVQDREER